MKGERKEKIKRYQGEKKEALEERKKERRRKKATMF